MRSSEPWVFMLVIKALRAKERCCEGLLDEEAAESLNNDAFP